MAFDWKKTLPYIGAIATGNVPALVAAAAADLSNVLGVEVKATPTAIDEAIKSATPEQLLAIKTVDANLKIKIAELEVEKVKIAATTEETYVKDVGDARKFNANTHGILILGYGINAFSYICIGGVLYGCFAILGGAKPTVDPGIAAMVGGVVGAAVQWIMGNAAQANGFFFGSSPSSRQSASEIAKAVGTMVQPK